MEGRYGCCRRKSNVSMQGTELMSNWRSTRLQVIMPSTPLTASSKPDLMMTKKTLPGILWRWEDQVCTSTANWSSSRSTSSYVHQCFKFSQLKLFFPRLKGALFSSRWSSQVADYLLTIPCHLFCLHFHCTKIPAPRDVKHPNDFIGHNLCSRTKKGRLERKFKIELFA